MIVHLYTTCWNEADILPFFFRHYDSWIDRYIVFDNGSSDNSLEILRAHPKVDLRFFPWSHADSFVLSQQELYNSIWQESRKRADWAVITAVDEHLHVPGIAMKEYLARAAHKRVTWIPALGLQMFSEAFPQPDERLCETRTTGAPLRLMSKLSVFAPNALTETGFDTGRHKATPRGRLRLPRRDELLLLHYKYIGFERILAHHARERSGLRAHDQAMQWGDHYDYSRAQLREYWDSFKPALIDIARLEQAVPKYHREKRWWRSRFFNHRQRLKRHLARVGR